MSRTKEYLAEAIDAWRRESAVIPNDVALYLIEELALVNKTRGGVRIIRDANASREHLRDVVDAADAVFGWMVAGGVRQITAEVYDHLRAEYARAQNARVEAAGNMASLTLPDVTIGTCMSDAKAERTLVVQIDTSHRVSVHLNDGDLYEGDPDVDGVIPVPQELAQALFDELTTFCQRVNFAGGDAKRAASELAESPDVLAFLDLYQKAVAR